MIAGLASRRAARQAVIVVSTVVAGAAVYLLIPSPNLWRRLTLATAYPGLALMAVTLWLGPWYVWRRRRPPVSVAWRRDVGIWAGILAAIHTLVGLEVHFRGDWRRYFFFPADNAGGRRIRTDAIGWANHAGLIALLVLLVLVAISNDLALRRLGARRWKAVQRWNYVAFALVGVHAVIFQIMTRRPFPAVVAVVGVLGVTVVVQLLGIRARRALPAGPNQ